MGITKCDYIARQRAADLLLRSNISRQRSESLSLVILVAGRHHPLVLALPINEMNINGILLGVSPIVVAPSRK